MCMLTVVKTPSVNFNKEMLTLLLMLNSTANKDGTGMFSGQKSWKTDMSANKTTNLGEIVDIVMQDSESKTYCGHVRAASTGVPVTLENAHPFVSDEAGIILAHNGKLVPIKRPSWLPAMDVYKTSDSYVFLKELEVKILSQGKNRDVVLALQETMKAFTGKFAFLIYDTMGNNYYAVRGKTAKLFVSYVKDEKEKQVGYIINTDDDRINHAELMLRNLKESVKDTMYTIDEPVLLEDEKIFLLGKDILECGDIKENTATTTSYSGAGYGNYRGKNRYPYAETTKNIPSSVEGLLYFMNKYNLSPSDMDRLFQSTISKTLSSVEEKDAKDFLQYAATRLTASKNMCKWIKKSFPSGVPASMYVKFGLEWPWMLNELHEIKSAAGKHRTAEKTRAEERQKNLENKKVKVKE